jgi:hypothetical protein
VLVAVWGTRVPEVGDVLDVVPAGELVEVDPDVDVVVGAVVVVVDDVEGDGLLEHAASARAQAGRAKRQADQGRRVLIILRAYGGSIPTWGLVRIAVPPERRPPAGIRIPGRAAAYRANGAE